LREILFSDIPIQEIVRKFLAELIQNGRSDALEWARFGTRLTDYPSRRQRTSVLAVYFFAKAFHSDILNWYWEVPAPNETLDRLEIKVFKKILTYILYPQKI